MKTHKAIGIIPARGGSKRIPRKNLVDLGGMPLIAHSILSAKKSKYIKNNLYVSTEDHEIAKVSERLGAKVLIRPKILSSDTAQTLDVLKQAVNLLEERGVDFDTVILLQPTSPLRRTQTINSGLEKLWNNWKRLDVIFSLMPAHHPYYWQLVIKNEKLEFVLPNDFSKIRSQDFEKTYEIDGVIYVLKKDFLKTAKGYQFSRGRSGYVLTDIIERLEIDYPQELDIVRSVLEHLKDH